MAEGQNEARNRTIAALAKEVDKLAGIVKQITPLILAKRKRNESNADQAESHTVAAGTLNDRRVYLQQDGDDLGKSIARRFNPHYKPLDDSDEEGSGTASQRANEASGAYIRS